MHPIVTVFLMFGAFGCLYYVYTNPAILGAGYEALRAKAGISNGQIVSVLFLLLAAYTVYWLVGYLGDTVRQKMAERNRR